ncbi:MAG: glycosyltransferase [Planctomycetota bacterium]
MEGATAVPVSVLILTLNEADNIGTLLCHLREVLAERWPAAEFVVVDADSPDRTAALAREAGARVMIEKERGYGIALRRGLAAARGERVVTLDADHSHEPGSVPELLDAAEDAEIVIGSRYIRAGRAEMPPLRRLLSVALNIAFRKIFDLPVKDASSGFRVYRRSIFGEMRLSGRDFEILQEILIGAWRRGARIAEVPIHYRPRSAGASKARVLLLGWRYLGALFRLARRSEGSDGAARGGASRADSTRPSGSA